MASSVIRVSWDASRDLTGLAGGSDGRMAYIHNIGPGTGTIKDESASSSAANRFALNGDYALAADCSVILMYDSTSSRWRLFGQQAASGSSPPFNDSTVLIQDQADNTKTMRFELGGFLPASARVLTPQDANYTIENTGHASKHVSGGGDSIKLDDLAAPDDNTDLDASTLSHGLMPKLTGSTTTFFRSDGTQAVPASTLDINGLTASDYATDDSLPFYDTSAAANKKGTVSRIHGMLVSKPTGRLSVESNVLYSSSDQINKSTLYWVGPPNLIYYDGTRYEMGSSPGSLTLSGMTANKNYDVFYDFSTGMDLAPAWTSDTARATGITLTNGLWWNTSTFTSVINAASYAAGKCLYLGTIRANDATTIDDTEAKRHIWNAYSRVRRPVRVFETTDTWNYSTATWRQLNNSTANQISVVCGIAGASLINLWAHTRMSSSTIQVSYCGIGEDSTTAPATENMTCPLPVSVNTGYACGAAHLAKFPAIGRRYYAHLERGAGSGTQTWYGDAGVDPLFRAGLVGDYDC